MPIRTSRQHYQSTISGYCVSSLSYVSNIKEKLCFFNFRSAMKLMTYDMSRLKWATDQSVIIHHAKISPTIVLITNNFSHSVKFCGNDKISWLGSKFRGPRKTVGPGHHVSLKLQCSIFGKRILPVMSSRPTAQCGPYSFPLAVSDVRWSG